MPTFDVPVVIEINGSIAVEADSPEEAIKLAKREYDRCREVIKFAHTKLVDSPNIEVDFACGDDPDEVELDEEDEEELDDEA